MNLSRLLAQLFSPGPTHVLVAEIILFAVWGWQLVNCIRRRSFPELFGSEKASRWLWLVSFALFNPLQVLAYVVLVRFGSRRPVHSSRRSWGVVLLLVLLAASSFGIPGLQRDQAFTIEVKRPASWGLQATVAGIESRSSASTTTSDSGYPQGLRRVRVICDSEHPLVARAAHLICNDLVGLGSIERVEYVPFGGFEGQEPGALAPDLNVVIGAEGLQILTLPMHYRIIGRVQVILNREVDGFVDNYGNRDTRFRYGQYSVDASLDFVYSRTGLALGAARLGQPAEEIADWMRDLFLEDLRERQGVVWELPPIPNLGGYHPSPDLPALTKRSAEFWMSERDFLVHNRTLWTYSDSRSTLAAVESLGQDLELDGWRTSYFNTTLTARRGQEILVAGRPGTMEPLDLSFQMVDPTGGEVPGMTMGKVAADDIQVPIRVSYEERYADDDVEDLVAQWLADEVDPVLLLLVDGSLTSDQRRILRRRLIELDPPMPGHWIRIADLAREAEDLGAEIEALQQARAILDRGVVDGTKATTLDERLERLLSQG